MGRIGGGSAWVQAASSVGAYEPNHPDSFGTTVVSFENMTRTSELRDAKFSRNVSFRESGSSLLMLGSQ